MPHRGLPAPRAQGAPAEELYLLRSGRCAVVRAIPPEVVAEHEERTAAASPRRRGGGGVCGVGGAPAGGLAAAAAAAGSGLHQLHVGTVEAGEVFGEVGLLHGKERAASVVALQPCEAYVVTKYELSRLFAGCPELRARLMALSRSYPSDEELVKTWRHDLAWASYKGQLLGEVTRCDVPPEGIKGIIALPGFQPPPSIEPPPKLDETSDLYKWANNYLDTNVLNIMNDLFLDETPPPELARSPSSSASSKLTDALANAGRRGR